MDTNTLKILCWNRGRDGSLQDTRQAWDAYYMDNEADIIFLQEEVGPSSKNSLFLDKKEYEAFHSPEDHGLYNVVVKKRSRLEKCSGLSINIVPFLKCVL